MARYPNAIWRPVERYQPGGAACAPMVAYHRYCLHTAVSNGSLFNWFNTPGHAVSHFYVLAGGSVEQYIDTRFRSSANWEGNPDTISVESEDMGFPFPDWDTNRDDVPQWTDAQVQALAELGAWVAETHGIPIVACLNSKPGSRGFAYHRQGIDPWRVAGGEVWSKSTGKPCPGNRRVAQVPQVIELAKDGTMPTATEIAEAVWSFKLANKVNDNTDAALTMVPNIHKHIVDTKAMAATLLARDPADVDEAALASALATLLPAVDTASILTAIQGLPAETVAAIKAAL